MAIVKKYKSAAEEVKEHIPGLFTVTFSSNKKFVYNPGQFLHLALDEYDGIGQWPESRCFSMQSNPDERNVTITYSVKGTFTKRMSELLISGKQVWLKMPYGDIFDRGHSLNNCVFLAGGSGVTPFLSLFTYRTFAEYVNPVLYLGLRSSEYNVFSAEIETAKKINDSFTVNYVYQDREGLIDIAQVLAEHSESVYFISGPPIMIKNFKIALLNGGVAENRILTDDWE